MKTFIIDFNLNLNFETVSNHREVNNSNHGDMASLAWDYCSLIIRALHHPQQVHGIHQHLPHRDAHAHSSVPHRQRPGGAVKRAPGGGARWRRRRLGF